MKSSLPLAWRAASIPLLLTCAAFPLRAADCNGNGVPDEKDLLPSGFGLKMLEEIELGSSPSTLALAYLDGDGDLDIVTANSGSFTDPGNTISILWNRGKATFPPADILTVGR